MNSRSSLPLATALWALGLLFFLQLFTLYIESIYRMALIKLEMGAEMWGALLILAPLVLLAVGEWGERLVCGIAAAGLLATRIAAPFLGASAQIWNAGIGTACFLVLLCYALAGSNAVPRPDWLGATVLAVLLSIALRNIAWASLDLSLQAGSFPFGALALLAVAASAWLCKTGENRGLAASDARETGFGLFLLRVVGLFAAFTLLYLVVSSPGVVAAWSGGSYGFAVAAATAAWVAALYLPARFRANTLVLVVWNLLFIAFLVGGVFANRVTFPQAPGQVAVTHDQLWQQLPLYLALLLSPVLAFNVERALAQPARESLRKVAPVVVVGAGIMLLLTVLLIFTNTWGYTIGALRNMFFLPFALAGLMLLLTLPMATPMETPRWARAAATVVGALCLVVFIASRAKPIAPPPAADTLRIATYNMQQGSEVNGDESYLEQLTFLRALDADIIFLQESDTPRPSGGNVNAPELFARALGMHLYFGPTTVAGTFGTAILARYPLMNARTIYTYSEVDEVGTAVAEVVIDGRRVALLNNHPAGGESVHHAHVDAMLNEARKHENVIAAGDFNFRQDSPYYAKVVAELADTWLALHPDAVGDAESVVGGDAGDANRFDMRRRIDHVFVSDELEVVEAQYTLKPESWTDHPAYRCSLRWK